MRSRFVSFVVLLMAAIVFSPLGIAQVFYPSGTAGHRSPEAQKAAEEAKRTLAYDPHDLSGIWRISAPLMGRTPAPSMTAWGQEQFVAHKPSDDSPYRNLNEGNGACDPQGYPRSLGAGGYVEFVQTPSKILQLFQSGNGLGFGLREIYTDGRTLPPDLDPRWYGWALGH